MYAEQLKVYLIDNADHFGIVTVELYLLNIYILWATAADRSKCSLSALRA